MASELDMKVSTSSGLSSETAQQHSHKDNSTEDFPKQSDNQRLKHRNKNRNKKAPKPPYKPAYLDVIQLEIDKLKQETRRSYEIQARQNAANEPTELVEEEQAVLDNRLVTLAMIDKLEDLKLKLGSKDMIRRVSTDYQNLNNHTPVNLSEYMKAHNHLITRFQQETMTLLHLFYIVRLAQKGFFTFISQAYPDVDPDALVYLCDKLVGGSLFVVKDPVKAVRSSKKVEVFDLLHKLHIGAPEPIGGGYLTTFEQIQALIHDFIGSAMPSSTSKPIDQSPQQPQQPQQPPIWLVVPFDGMAGGTTQSKTAPTATSERKSESKKTPRKKNDKNASKSVPGDRTNDINSVASYATHDTESTQQASESVTLELGHDDHADNYSETPSIPERGAKRQLQTTTPTPSTDNTLTADAPLNTNGPSVDSTIDSSHSTDSGQTKQAIDDTVGEAITGVATTTDSTTAPNPVLEEKEDTSSGWGPPPTTETASSLWTQGSQQPQQQHDEIITTATEDKKTEDQEPSTGWGDTPATEAAASSWTQGSLQPQQQSDEIITTATEDKKAEDQEPSTGWGDATASEIASPSWTQGLVDQQKPQHKQDASTMDTPTSEDKTTTDGEASAGWGNASETAASSSWTQGSVEQQQQLDQQQQVDKQQTNGWGSPAAEDTTPPAWEGKLPDDLVTPGDETISGDVADSKWQTVEFDSRRPMGDGGRGRGARGGRHRSFNDGGRGGMRRGGASSSNSGWNSRPNRP